MHASSDTPSPQRSSPLVLPAPRLEDSRRSPWPWRRIRGPFLTAANLVSLLRLPIALAAVMFYLDGALISAGVLMVVAFASDALDGAIARATGTISEWGKILDPVSDKAVFAILGVMLVALGRVPLWLLLVLVVRDLLVVAGGYRSIGRKGDVPASHALGKLSTLLLAVYMIRQAFWPAEPLWLGLDALGWGAFAALAVSSVFYAVHYVLAARDDAAQPEVRGAARQDAPRAR